MCLRVHTHVHLPQKIRLAPRDLGLIFRPCSVITERSIQDPAFSKFGFRPGISFSLCLISLILPHRWPSGGAVLSRPLWTLCVKPRHIVGGLTCSACPAQHLPPAPVHFCPLAAILSLLLAQDGAYYSAHSIPSPGCGPFGPQAAHIPSPLFSFLICKMGALFPHHRAVL